MKKIEIFSPDPLTVTRAKVRIQGQESDVNFPEPQTYRLIAVYLKGRAEDLPIANTFKKGEKR